MSDLRNLAKRAESWQQNGDTPAGTSSDWAAFQRAALPDVVLALLDERDRLHRIAEAARRVAGFELGVILPTDDGLAAYIEAKNDLLAALQESR